MRSRDPEAARIENEYFLRLGAALARCPAEQRNEILQNVREHVRLALGEGAAVSLAEMADVLQRLGSPETVAAEAGGSAVPPPAAEMPRGGQKIDFRKTLNRIAKAICVVAVLSMIFGAVCAVYRWTYLRHAVTTEATITNLIERTAKDGDTLYAPVYVFTDQRGQPVKIISSTASYPPPGEVGDKLKVLYDPENPQHSIEAGFFSVWGLAVIFGGMGALDFIVFAGVAYFTGRHPKKNGGYEEIRGK